MSTRVKVNMKPVNTILAKLGVDKNGDVQRFVTNTINRRITRYMPYRSGVLSTKSKYIRSPTEIEVLSPYAKIMYFGEIMVDPVTGAAGFLTPNGWRSRTKAPHVPKVRSGRTFDYDTTKHPLAGPLWDKRMMAAEGDQIAAETQEYVNRRKS